MGKGRVFLNRVESAAFFLAILIVAFSVISSNITASAVQGAENPLADRIMDFLSGFFGFKKTELQPAKDDTLSKDIVPLKDNAPREDIAQAKTRVEPIPSQIVQAAQAGSFSNFITTAGNDKIFRKSVEDSDLEPFTGFHANNSFFVLHVGMDENKEEPPEYDGYIIELRYPPLVKQKSALENAGIKQASHLQSSLRNYRSFVESRSAFTKNRIKAIDPVARVGREFINTFSGFSIKNASEEKIKAIEKLPDVKKVHKNFLVKATLMDSVPMINAPPAWQTPDKNGNPITGKDVKIAIIDTGVDYTHPDLGGCFGPGCKVIGGYDFVNSDNDPMDDNGHGTHVAATAAGKGTLYGVAPDAKVYAYKVLNRWGSGYEELVIEGIERAVDPNSDGDFSDRADIISMSLGGSGTPDDAMATASDNAVDAGAVVVAAAGNWGPSSNSINCPGCARKAITVGAVYKNRTIAEFSSRGPVTWIVIPKNGTENSTTYTINKPDIVAPGVKICASEWDNARSWARCLDNYHVAISGTSMATPHVAGAVALLKQAHPDWGPEQIKTALKSTAEKLVDPVENIEYNQNTQGAGLVNPLAAINLPSSVNVTPNFIDFEGTPTTRSLQFTKNITIKNLDSTQKIFVFTLEINKSGITGNFSKNSIQTPGSRSGDFLLNLKIDNDLVKSNAVYYGYILVYANTFDCIERICTMNESSVLDAKIPIRIKINPNINVDVQNVDLGRSNPSQATWISNKAFSIRNVRLDAPVSLDYRIECCIIKDKHGGVVNITNYDTISNFNFQTGKPPVPYGFGFALSQNPQVIGKGMVSNNSLIAYLANQYLGNGIYEGKIIISGPSLKDYEIPFSFVRFHIIDATFNYRVVALGLFNRTEYEQFGLIIHNLSNLTFYVENPGIYDMLVYSDRYRSRIPLDADTLYIKEGINVNGIASVHVKNGDPESKLYFNFLNESGKPLEVDERCLYNTLFKYKKLFLALGVFARNCGYPFVTSNTLLYLSNSSNLSADYGFLITPINTSKAYFFTGNFTGISGDHNINNSANDLIKLDIKYNYLDPPNAYPILYLVTKFEDSFLVGSGSGFIQPNGTNLIKTYLTNQQSSFNSLTAASYDNSEVESRETFAIVGNNATSVSLMGTTMYLNKTEEIYNIRNGLLSIGQNAEFFFGRIADVSERKMTLANPGLLKFFIPQSLDNIYLPAKYVVYELYKDNMLFETNLVPDRTGIIGHHLYLYGYGNYSIIVNYSNFTILPIDRSFVNISYTYNYNSTANLSFNNALDDPLPPYFKSLRIYSGSNLSDYIYSTRPLAIEIGADDDTGVAEVRATVFYKSGASQQYVLAKADGLYRLVVAAPVAPVQSLGVQLKDTSGNSLSYKWEMPFVISGCSDGTPYGTCSKDRPYYCEASGILAAKCSVCGCFPNSICRADGSCEVTLRSPRFPATNPIQPE